VWEIAHQNTWRGAVPVPPVDRVVTPLEQQLINLTQRQLWFHTHDLPRGWTIIADDHETVRINRDKSLLYVQPNTISLPHIAQEHRWGAPYRLLASDLPISEARAWRLAVSRTIVESLLRAMRRYNHDIDRRLLKTSYIWDLVDGVITKLIQAGVVMINCEDGLPRRTSLFNYARNPLFLFSEEVARPRLFLTTAIVANVLLSGEGDWQVLPVPALAYTTIPWWSRLSAHPAAQEELSEALETSLLAPRLEEATVAYAAGLEALREALAARLWLSLLPRPQRRNEHCWVEVATQADLDDCILDLYPEDWLEGRYSLVKARTERYLRRATKHIVTKNRPLLPILLAPECDFQLPVPTHKTAGHIGVLRSKH